MHKGTTKYRDSSKRAERVTQRCCTDRATYFFSFWGYICGLQNHKGMAT